MCARRQFSDNLFVDPRRVEFVLRAAALVTLRDGRVSRFYTTWFDDAWAHYSPGTALLFEVTRRSLAEGLDCDYMTGTQSQKLRFRIGSIPLFRAEASAEQLAQIAGEGERLGRWRRACPNA
jgi:hypothetical protein